jgi:hypothetical protein
MANLRNSEKHIFLLGPGRTFLINALASVGLKAKKAGSTHISNSIDSVKWIEQAKVWLKNDDGCKQGFMHDYTDNGMLCLSNSHMRVEDRNLSRDSDTVLFFLSEKDRTLYGVRVSKLYERTNEGQLYWEWVMAARNEVAILTDASGVTAAHTVANAEKMKSIAEFIIPVNEKEVDKYHKDRIAYGLSY